MIYYARGSESDILNEDDLREGLFSALEKLGLKEKVLAFILMREY